jgi:hypothetical protein
MNILQVICQWKTFHKNLCTLTFFGLIVSETLLASPPDLSTLSIAQRMNYLYAITVFDIEKTIENATAEHNLPYLAGNAEFNRCGEKLLDYHHLLTQQVMDPKRYETVFGPNFQIDMNVVMQNATADYKKTVHHLASIWALIKTIDQYGLEIARSTNYFLSVKQMNEQLSMPFGLVVTTQMTDKLKNYANLITQRVCLIN